MIIIKYYADIPYPEVKVEKQNKEYAYLLSYAYAGIVSELTAINTYSFQTFILNNDIAKIIEGINIVEIHHLELLGKTIKLLGLDPKFQTYNPNINWNSSFVDYETNLNDIFDNNIMGEQMAIENYQKLIDVINDKYIKDLLNRIILDEKIHISIFETLKKR